jgi:hypothetical protein
MKACELPEKQYAYVRNLLSGMVEDDLIHRTRQGKYSATVRGMVRNRTDDDEPPF